MGWFRFIARGFHQDRIVEAGEKVLLPDNVFPGAHMVACDPPVPVEPSLATLSFEQRERIRLGQPEPTPGPLDTDALDHRDGLLTLRRPADETPSPDHHAFATDHGGTSPAPYTPNHPGFPTGHPGDPPTWAEPTHTPDHPGFALGHPGNLPSIPAPSPVGPGVTSDPAHFVPAPPVYVPPTPDAVWPKVPAAGTVEAG